MMDFIFIESYVVSAAKSRLLLAFCFTVLSLSHDFITSIINFFFNYIFTYISQGPSGQTGKKGDTGPPGSQGPSGPQGASGSFARNWKQCVFKGLNDDRDSGLVKVKAKLASE